MRSTARPVMATSWYEAAERAKVRGARMSFGFAGKELAKILGKNLGDITTHQLKATLVDYGALLKAEKELGSRLSGNTTGTLISGSSELSFQLGDEAGLEDGVVDEEDISTGHNVAYLPPGMLSKEVRADSATGRVKLSPTLTWRGIIDDAVLEFEHGQLVKWSSRSSKERLDAMINDQPESESASRH